MHHLFVLGQEPRAKKAGVLFADIKLTPKTYSPKFPKCTSADFYYK